MDLLSEDNYCGRNLLKLVSRGSAILAELQRLSEYIPPAFLDEPPPEAQVFAPVIMDFEYLKNLDDFEEKIALDYELSELDENLRESHTKALERFYMLFESMYKYYTDYMLFLSELIKGDYIQHSPESLMQDFEGRKLMCEALYLWGVMLFMTDQKIPGTVRERLLVSYYRYKGQSVISNIDEVCSLFRDSGFDPEDPSGWPTNYPDAYMNRLRIPEDIVSLLLSHLKDDDLFGHIITYPSPDHRSTALANQASMLFIIMYFAPNLLQKENNRMREIVDKFFTDTWVVPYYLGFTVDLVQYWKNYKAASTALMNYTLDMDNINTIHQKYIGKVRNLNKALNHYLKEGILVDEYVLSHTTKLIHCMRDCNVALRWLLLQKRTSIKKLRDIVTNGLDMSNLMRLLMHSAQFELMLKARIEGIMGQRPALWEEDKYQAEIRMQELSEFFSGNRPLVRGITKNENYVKWFAAMAQQINILDFNDSNNSSKTIQRLIQALEEIEQYQQIEDNLQVRAFINETRQFLKHMVSIANLNESMLTQLARISDFSYGMLCMEDFLELIQETLKREPNTVLLLKATIIKLTSIMDAPLLRILQSNSLDLESVSEHYSKILVNYISRVLQVIPQAIFEKLDQISNLHATSLPDLQGRVKREQLRDIACLEDRYLLAQFTNQIAIFTQGVLGMEKTVIGLIEVDPRQLLEEGIRREIVRKFAEIISLAFNRSGLSYNDFITRIENLGLQLLSLSKSFEFVQDYLGVFALKLWQEELNKLIMHNVDIEASAYVTTRQQGVDVDNKVDIPRIEAADESSVTFIGQLVKTIISFCNPKDTIYIGWMHGWYDHQGNEIIGLNIMTRIHNSLGVLGLSGIDNLLSCTIYSALKNFIKKYRDLFQYGSLSSLCAELQPTSMLPERKGVYAQTIQQLQSKLNQLHTPIMRIGQMQLLKTLIAYELNFRARTDSPLLWNALRTVNLAVLNDVKYNPDLFRLEDQLLQNLDPYLQQMGFSAPFEKVYVKPGQMLEKVPAVMAFYTISQMKNLTYDKRTSGLIGSKGANVDGGPLAAGILTVLRQFHENYLKDYFGYLTQYINIGFSSIKERKGGDIPPDVGSIFVYIDEVRKYAGLPRMSMDQYFPAFIPDVLPFNQ